MANKAAFTIAVGLSKAFAIAMHGYVVANTWIFRTKDKINIGFIPKFTVKFVSAINVRTIRMNVSKIILAAGVRSAIQLRKIRIVAYTKARMKLSFATILRIGISAYTKAKQKITMTMRLRKVAIAFVPIVAAFYTLGDYATSTLGAMDTSTLGALDYTL